MDQPSSDDRIDLALTIFADAQNLTGSEVAEGMKRALECTDAVTYVNLREEFEV